MKTLLLLLSLVLNIVLVVALVVLHNVSKKSAFSAVASAAAAEVAIEEYILSELESGDAARIEKIKQALKLSIEGGKKEEARFRSLAR